MIRTATEDDIPELLRLIRALAEYEREPDAVETTEDDLHRALFLPNPKVFALVAQDDDETIIGMAIYFLSFSTWTGRHSLYLEDLFVDPASRRQGTGQELLAALAAKAVELGCQRMEWAVLNWNEPAIGFYRSLGAVPMDEWTTFRLAGPALAALTQSATAD